MFEVKVKLASLAAPGRTEEISLLVDTGASHLVMDTGKSFKAWRDSFLALAVLTRDGRVLERDTTAVLLIIDEEKLRCQLLLENRARRRSLARQLSKFLGLSWTQSKRN